jgi:hypothetical protein
MQKGTAPHAPVHDVFANDAVWLFVRDPARLEEKKQATLTARCQASGTANVPSPLVQEFRHMLHHREGSTRGDWLEKVKASQIRELQSCVTGVERNKAAVVARLTLSQNNERSSSGALLALRDGSQVSSSSFLPTGKKGKRHREAGAASWCKHLCGRAQAAACQVCVCVDIHHRTSAGRNAGDKQPWALATGMNMLALRDRVLLEKMRCVSRERELQHEVPSACVAASGCAKP